MISFIFFILMMAGISFMLAVGIAMYVILFKNNDEIKEGNKWKF